jgi:hypothetical protein
MSMPAAMLVSASGSDPPSRNENADRQWSSAYFMDNFFASAIGSGPWFLALCFWLLSLASRVDPHSSAVV